MLTIKTHFELLDFTIIYTVFLVMEKITVATDMEFGMKYSVPYMARRLKMCSIRLYSFILCNFTIIYNVEVSL
jgi:hypothetical protein